MRTILLTMCYGIPIMLACHWGIDVLGRDTKNGTARIIAAIHFLFALRVFFEFWIQVLPVRDAPSIVRYLEVPCAGLLAAVGLRAFFNVVPGYSKSPWRSSSYALAGLGFLAIILPLHLKPFATTDYVRQGFWVKSYMSMSSRIGMVICAGVLSFAALRLRRVLVVTQDPRVRASMLGLFRANLVLVAGYTIFGVLVPSNAFAWLPSNGYMLAALIWLAALRVSIIRDFLVPSQFQRYFKLFQASPTPMVLTDSSGQLIDANLAATSFLGRVVNLAEAFPETTRVGEWERFRHQLRADSSLTNWEQTVVNRSHSERIASMDGEAISHGDTTHWIFSLRDITEQRRQQNRASDLASRDSLTGLSNQQALLTQADRWIRSGAVDRMLLVFVDLDNFKEINDSLGHLVGNRVLVEVARRLRLIGRTNDLTARFGGDEFVILRPNCDAAEAEAVRREVSCVFSDPIVFEGMDPIQVKASIGLSQYPEDGTTAERIVDWADQAMYRAKQERKSAHQGHGRERFSESAKARREAARAWTAGNWDR